MPDNESTLPMTVDTSTTTPKDFLSSASLKNYATATASLTLVINISLYVYKAMRNGKDMPLGLLIPIALVLSAAYILTFFKRETGLTSAQHIWITGLNSLMLFTSISGVNGMLDTAKQSFIANKQTTGAVVHLSVGTFLEHIFFPTHGWFNKAEKDEKERTRLLQESITALDSANRLIDTVIRQNEADRNQIEVLTKKIDSSKTAYNLVVDRLSKTEVFLQDISPIVQRPDVSENIKTRFVDLQSSVGSDKTKLLYQRDQLSVTWLTQNDEPFNKMIYQKDQLENKRARLVKLQ